MEKLKEKSFTVYVTLNDNSYVQTMLENLYNEGTLRYDSIRLDGTDVVSDEYYKGLKYGSIDGEALSRKTAIEDEGYHLEYIFTVTEKQQDPFIDFYGHRPDEYCILEEISYVLKLKFSFARLVDNDEADEATASSGSNGNERRQLVRLSAPF